MFCCWRLYSWLAASWHLGAEMHVALVQGLISGGSHTGHRWSFLHWIGTQSAQSYRDKLQGRVSLYMAKGCLQPCHTCRCSHSFHRLDADALEFHQDEPVIA